MTKPTQQQDAQQKDSPRTGVPGSRARLETVHDEELGAVAVAYDEHGEMVGTRASDTWAPTRCTGVVCRCGLACNVTGDGPEEGRRG